MKKHSIAKFLHISYLLSIMDNQKIFFSYSRVDADEFALKLANDLRNAGANVWIDQVDILPAQKWDTEIHKALVTSDCVLFIVTEASVNSDNVLDEVNYALNNKKKVYPIIKSKCELPYRTSRLQHIDFMGNHEKGFTTLLKALNLDTNTNKKTSAGTVNDEKIDLNEKKPYKEANDKDRTPSNPEDADAYNNQGTAKCRLGKIQEGIQDYLRAIELKPDHAVAYCNLAASEYKLGRIDESVRDFTKAIELNPDYAEAYVGRGNARRYEGKNEEAILDYTRAIELKPDYALAFYNRGVVKGDDDAIAGCQDLKKSCELGYAKGCEEYNSLCK